TMISSAWPCTASRLTMPLATVAATATDRKAPTRFSTADSATAVFGFSAPVAMDGAIAFPVSWKPLVKSNAKAVAITIPRISNSAVTPPSVGPYRWVVDRPYRPDLHVGARDRKISPVVNLAGTRWTPAGVPAVTSVCPAARSWPTGRRPVIAAQPGGRTPVTGRSFDPHRGADPPRQLPDGHGGDGAVHLLAACVQDRHARPGVDTGEAEPPRQGAHRHGARGQPAPQIHAEPAGVQRGRGEHQIPGPVHGRFDDDVAEPLGAGPAGAQHPVAADAHRQVRLVARHDLAQLPFGDGDRDRDRAEHQGGGVDGAHPDVVEVH